MSTPLKRSIDTSATFACMGTLACWTAAPIFIELLTGQIDLWTQNLLRYATACLFWLPFLVWMIGRKRLAADVWRRAVLPSIANIILQTLWAAAFYYIDPAFMILLIKSSVLWIAGFSLLFFPQERGLLKSKRFWCGMTLSAAGVVGVVLGHEGFGQKKEVVGIVLGLLAALGWSVYTISAKIAFKNIDSRAGFSVITIYTVAGLGVLAFLFGEPGECMEMGAKGWSWVVISGIVGIAVCHVLYYTAMKRIGATIPAMVSLATPFTVLAISYVVFGESLNGLQWLFGIVLVIGSVFAIRAQEHLKSS